MALFVTMMADLKGGKMPKVMRNNGYVKTVCPKHIDP